MTELILRLRDQMTLAWERLNNRQRVVLVVGGVALVVALVLILRLSVRREYGTLFSGLAENDAAAVVARLEERGVPFQIGDGGTAILVPSSNVLDERLRLASEGLPSRGIVGFEVFDDVSFTITDLTQRVNFQRALEGELVRTIQSLDAVQLARVHLVLPEQALFADQQSPTTASVVLNMKAGSRLAIDQIGGIRNLVASSVEKLTPEAVTIVDSSGTVLTEDLAAADMFGAAASATQLEVQRNFENERRIKIQQFIATVVGPNKSAVSVQSDFNWNISETFTESFIPSEDNSGIPRSQQKITETFTGAAEEAPGGVPGVSANLPGEVEGSEETSTTGQSEYARSESVTNFDISRSENTLTTAAGIVKRIAIVVFLDESLDADAVTSIQEGLTAFIDVERGDTLSVQQITFDTTVADEVQRQIQTAESQARMTQLVTLGVVIVVVSAVLFFMLRLMRAIRRAVVVEPPVPELTELEAAELQRLGLAPDMEGLSPEEARAALQASQEREREDMEIPVDEEAMLEDEELARIMASRDRTRGRLLKLASDRPDEVVRLLETWLAQD